MARLAVVASQILLITGFVWFAADWWAGPNDEHIAVNIFALAVAGVLAFVLVLWVRGIRVPLVAANAILAAPFAFSLFALLTVPIWGDTGSTLAALGLVATIVSAVAGFTSAPSGRSRAKGPSRA